MSRLVELDIHRLLGDILYSKNDGAAYTAMTQLMALLKEDSSRMEYLPSYHYHRDVIKRLLSVIGRMGADHAQAALQVLVHFLHQESVCKTLDAEFVFDSLCSTLQKADDKQICIRILWCMEKQEFPIKAFDNFLKFDDVFRAMRRLLRRENMTFTSATLDFEIGGVLKRFLSQCPYEMMTRVDDWLDILFLLAMNSAKQVHDVAMELFSEYKLVIDERRPLGAYCLANLEKLIVPAMKKLLTERGTEREALATWCYFLELLGPEAHHRSVINKLLFVVEAAFKNPDSNVKIAAFQSWTVLMDSFATNASVLNNNKHIRLLMQPFLVNNAKCEDIALAKFDAWWHLIVLLREQMGEHFDLVLSPLLSFASGQPVTMPHTPSRIGSLSPSVSMPSFASVQLRGCECLVHLLESSEVQLLMPKSSATYSFTVPPLSDGVKVLSSPQRFLKNHKILIGTAKRLVMSLQSAIPAPLLYRLFNALVSHCDVMVTSLGWGVTSPAATAFMTSFEAIVTATSLDGERLMRLFRNVCLLPDKFLCCHQFYTGEDRNGCPALTLLELLLGQKMIAICEHSQRMEMFTDIVKMGVAHGTNMLKFSHSALALLAGSANRIEDKERLFQLWSSLAKTLHDQILKTNEVNQGDALEHDFSCMYDLLAFPVQHILVRAVPQSCHASLNKLWSDVYSTFSRLSALVANAPPNTCADQSAARIVVTSTVTSLTTDVTGEKWEVLLAHTLCTAVETMTSCLDYSAFSNHRPSAFSPSKFMSPPSKRQKPLGTLHHATQLLSLLLQLLTKLNEKASTQTKLLNEAGAALLRAITDTIQGVTSPSILQILIQELTENLALMIRKSTKIGEEKSVFSAEFTLKVQSFWADVGKVWLARFPGTKDSEFLDKVEPLFTATFQHQKKQIKQTSLSLWSAWFASAEHLTYPDQLRPVLTKLKDKHSISLPGFHPNVFDAAKDSAVSESQLTQGESQVPLPDIAGLPSPAKKVHQHGSFLTKIPSPAKSTPEKQDGAAVAKRQATPFPRATKSAAHAQDEFVVIAPEPKKKLVLTDHQKEVMRRKSALPSMYNNLDASVDTSMHTDFFSQSEGSSQDVPASASLLPQVSQLFPSSQPIIPSQNIKNAEKTETVQKAENTENEENNENKENQHVRKVHFADEKDSDVMILSQKGEEKMEIEITDTPMETSEVVEETQLSMSEALASATGKTKAKESESENKQESEEHSNESAKKKENSKPQTRRGKKKEEGTGDPFSKAKRATPLKLSEVSSSQSQSKEDKTVKLSTGKEVISSQIGFSSPEEERSAQVQVRSRKGKKEEKSSSKEEKKKRSLSPRALDLGGGGDASQDSNFKAPENVTPERESTESRSEIRVGSCSILVEDTQSPEKFNSVQRKRLSTATESSESELNESVAETPEKQPKATEIAEDTPDKVPVCALSKEGELTPSDSLKKIPGKRRLMELDQKLFSDTATSESDSVYDADTEVVPESQIAKQPKVVLKKLTPAKILQYSPKKKSPPRTSPVVSPVATRSKRKSLLGVKADYQVFETTRGSSSDQDIVPCSQGFGSQASKDGSIESSQDQTLVPESELSQKTTRSSAKTAEVSSSKKTESKTDKECVSKTGKETESDLLTSDDDLFKPKTDLPKDDRAARELKKLSIDMVAISLPRAKRRRSVRDRLDVTKEGDDVIKEGDDVSKDEPMGDGNAADQETISAKDVDSKEPIEAKETEPEVVPETKTNEDEPNKKAEEATEVVKETKEEKMEEEVFYDAVEESKPNSMETEPGSNESVAVETESKINEKLDEKLSEESSEAKPEKNATEQEMPVFKSPDKLENPEMPETPKSSGGHRVVRRRFTSAQKSPVASRGMRLLALAKQSNLGNKDKTSPTKRDGHRKPSGVMTDPVRRRGISRVDIILSRSRKALNKSLAAADATSGSSGDDPEQPRRSRPEPRLPSGLSPVMSPGSGILKKRKYMDAACDSPSPPNKHRRVSFAASDDVRVMSEHGDLDLRIKSPMSDAKLSLGAKMCAESLDKPAVSRCLEMTRGASPLVDKTRKVELSSSKSIVSSIPEETSEEPIPEMDKSSAPASESVPPSETLATEPTQQSAESMDMDNVKPVCDKLVYSDVPLTDVIGQLTTTMWSHSLKEVLKARNLVTVGDLAKLTEYETHRLPGVKSPRVETVRAVMDKLVQENELAAAELALKSMSPIKPAESPLRSLPSAEEALDSLSPEKEEATEDELDETIEMEQTGEGCQTKTNSSSVQLRLDTDDELTSSQENGNPDDDVKVVKDGNPEDGQIGKIANDDDSTLDSLPEGVSSSDQVISFKNVSTIEETKVDEVLESEGFDAGEGDMDVDDDVTMSGPMTSTQVDDVVSPEVKRRRSSRRLRVQSQSAIEASETLDQSAKGRRNKKVVRDNEKSETEKDTDEQSKTKNVVPATVQSKSTNKSHDPSPIVIDQSESTPDTDETILEQSKLSEASVSILNQSGKATRSRDSTNQSEARTDGPIVIEDSQDSQDTNNNHVDSSKESTPTEQNLWLQFDSILKQILAEEMPSEMPSEGKKMEILLDMSRVQTKLLNLNLPSTSKSGTTQQK